MLAYGASGHVSGVTVAIKFIKRAQCCQIERFLALRFVYTMIKRETEGKKA